MGRPIYVHQEHDDAPGKADQECRTWPSFARRLERHLLRDPEATLDATNDSMSPPRSYSPMSTSAELPDHIPLPPASASDEEWDALEEALAVNLSAREVRGTTRSVAVRRSPWLDAPRSHPVTWAHSPATQAAPSSAAQLQESGDVASPWQEERLMEWASPSPRSRRLRHDALSEGSRGWAALSRHRNEASRRAPGRRASGDIPSVREAWDSRSTTALEMARHAARDLLRQLDVRIAESRARNQYLALELGRSLEQMSPGQDSTVAAATPAMEQEDCD